MNAIVCSAFWQQALDNMPDHVRIVTNPVDMALIADERINMVIWARDLPEGLSMLWRQMQSIRTPIRGDWMAPDEQTLRVDIQKYVRDPIFGPAVAWLAYDIAMLVARYAELTGVVRPRVRLERVEDGGCVLFHEDYMEMRLMCTYAGPGMQWVANQDVRRSELGLQGRSVREANAAAVPNADRIRSIPAGEVAVFKGALHPRCACGALIHRSAPVSSPSEFRIRLCIDATSNCAC